MTNFIRLIERVGALALFLIVVVMTTTTSTRYFFNWPLPDADAASQLLLAVAVFWGFAGACRRGEHIQLDLIVERLPTAMRAVVVWIASLILFVAVVFMSWMSAERIIVLKHTGETTYDLGLPLWPFYAAACVGLVVACIVLAMHLITGIARLTPKL